jgi:hypothetical protein
MDPMVFQKLKKNLGEVLRGGLAAFALGVGSFGLWEEATFPFTKPSPPVVVAPPTPTDRVAVTVTANY